MNKILFDSDRIRNSKLRGVYERLPLPVKRMYRFLRKYPEFHAYRSDARGRTRTVRLLQPYRDRFLGKRAVILGNGPSLKNTPWHLLKNEYTFGLNRINLLFDAMGFQPNFYLCVKNLVIEQFGSELSQIKSELKVFDFLAGRRHITLDERSVLLPSLADLSFSTQLTEGWSTGFTVTFAAMQLAHFLGFRKLVLVGIDHRFQTSGAPRMNEVSGGPDLNHFHPDYFGAGVKWQYPDLVGSERAYRLAADAFARSGGNIIDCTEGGALEVFQKRSLEAELANR